MGKANNSFFWLTVYLLGLLLLNISLLENGAHASTLQKCYPKLGCFDGNILNALPQEPAYVRTEFRLSCKDELDNGTVLAVEDETKWRDILGVNSCFQVQRETAFVIHGFRDKGESRWVTDIRNFLVTERDYNVFALDWNHGAGFLYEQAAANTFLVAKQLSLFIEFLESIYGLDPHRIHLIGHSLGAHIAGNTGGALKSFQLARITGLDPADPYFEQVKDDKRLDKGDASFVDVIHTDGERFTGFKGLGSTRSQGHVDFYPNGGQKQPGCQSQQQTIGFDSRTVSENAAASGTGCSHSRAHQLFVQSLTSIECHFEAMTCSSWDEFNKGSCTSCPPGGCARMGLATLHTARGNLYFGTTYTEPYCGSTYFVKLTTTPGQGHSYGQLEMDILDVNTTHNHGYLYGGDNHFHQSQTFQYAVTLPSEVRQVSVVQILYVKGSGLSSLWTSSSLDIGKISVTSLDGQHSWDSCGSIHLNAGQPFTVDMRTDQKLC